MTQSRALAVALFDLSWLLPRTIGSAAARKEPLPPTALETMRILARRPGMSVNEVAREIGVLPNNVSTAVTHLETQGLLERHRDENDGRVARLYPTQRALLARQAREDAWGAGMAAALDRLSEEEATSLLAALPALRALAADLAGQEPS